MSCSIWSIRRCGTPPTQPSPGFASAIGAQRDGNAATAPLALRQAGQIARAWSLVHGFSMLLLDGRLGGYAAPPAGRDHAGNAVRRDADWTHAAAAAGVTS